MTFSLLLFVFSALIQGYHGEIASTIYSRYSYILRPCELTPGYRPSTIASEERRSLIYAFGEIRASCLDTNSTEQDIDIKSCLQDFLPRVWHTLDSGTTWDCYFTDPSLNRMSNSLLMYSTQNFDYDTNPSILVNTGPGDGVSCTMLCSFGGWVLRASNVTASNEVFCSFDGGRTWVKQAPLPYPLVHSTAYQHLNNIFLVGGESDDTEATGFLKATFESGECHIRAWRQSSSFIRGREYGEKMTPFRNHRYPLVTSIPDGSGLFVGGGHLHTRFWTLSSKAPRSQVGHFSFNNELWSTSAYPLDLSLWTFVSNTLPVSYSEANLTVSLGDFMFPKIVLSSLVDTTKSVAASTPSFTFSPYPTPNTDLSYTRWASHYLHKVNLFNSSLILITPNIVAISKDMGDSWEASRLVDYPYPQQDDSATLLPYIHLTPTTGTDDMAQVLILSHIKHPIDLGLQLNVLYPRTSCYSQCGPGHYSLGCTVSPTDSRCFPCRSCGANSYVVTPCAGGFLGYGDTRCAKCSACGPDEVMVTPCNQTHDTICTSEVADSMIQTWSVFHDDASDFFRGYDADIHISTSIILLTLAIILYTSILLFSLFLASSKFNTALFGRKWVAQFKRFRTFLTWIKHPLHSKVSTSYFLHTLAPDSNTSSDKNLLVQSSTKSPSQETANEPIVSASEFPQPSYLSSSPDVSKQGECHQQLAKETTLAVTVESEDMESNRLASIATLYRAPIEYILSSYSFLSSTLFLFTIRGIVMTLLSTVQLASAFAIYIVTNTLISPYARISRYYYVATSSLVAFYAITLLMTCMGMCRFKMERRKYRSASRSAAVEELKCSQFPKHCSAKDCRDHIEGKSSSIEVSDTQCVHKTTKSCAASISFATKGVSLLSESTSSSETVGNADSISTSKNNTKINHFCEVIAPPYTASETYYRDKIEKPRTTLRRAAQLLVFDLVYYHVHLMSFLHPRVFFAWSDLFHVCFPYTILQNSPMLLTSKTYQTSRIEDFPEAIATDGNLNASQSSPTSVIGTAPYKPSTSKVPIVNRPLVYPGGIINWKVHKRFRSPFVPPYEVDRQMLDRFFPKSYINYQVACTISLVGDLLVIVLCLVLITTFSRFANEEDLRKFENVHIWDDLVFLLSSSAGYNFEPPESTGTKPLRFVSRAVWDTVSSTTLELAHSKVANFARIFVMTSILTFILDLASCFRVIRVSQIHNTSYFSETDHVQSSNLKTDILHKDTLMIGGQNDSKHLVKENNLSQVNDPSSAASVNNCENTMIHIREASLEETISRRSSFRLSDASGSGLKSVSRNRSASSSYSNTYISADGDSPKSRQSDPHVPRVANRDNVNRIIHTYTQEWGGNRFFTNAINAPRSEAFDLLDDSISEHEDSDSEDAADQQLHISRQREPVSYRDHFEPRLLQLSPSIYRFLRLDNIKEYTEGGYSSVSQQPCPYPVLQSIDSDGQQCDQLPPAYESLQDEWRAHPFCVFLRQLEKLPRAQNCTISDHGNNTIVEEMSHARSVDSIDEYGVSITSEERAVQRIDAGSQSEPFSPVEGIVLSGMLGSESNATQSNNGDSTLAQEEMKNLLENPPEMPRLELISFAQRELASLLLRRLDLAQVPELLLLIDAMQSQGNGRHFHSSSNASFHFVPQSIDPNADGYFTDNGSDDSVLSETGQSIVQIIPPIDGHDHAQASDAISRNEVNLSPRRELEIPQRFPPCSQRAHSHRRCSHLEPAGFLQRSTSGQQILHDLVSHQSHSETNESEPSFPIATHTTLEALDAGHSGFNDSFCDCSTGRGHEEAEDRSRSSSRSLHLGSSQPRLYLSNRTQSVDTPAQTQAHTPDPATRPNVSNYLGAPASSHVYTPSYYPPHSSQIGQTSQPPTPPLQAHVPRSPRPRGVSHSLPPVDPSLISRSGATTPNLYPLYTRPHATSSDDVSDHRSDSPHYDSEANDTVDSVHASSALHSLPRYLSSHVLYTTPPFLSSRDTAQVPVSYSSAGVTPPYRPMSVSYSGPHYSSSSFSSEGHHGAPPGYRHSTGTYGRLSNHLHLSRHSMEFLPHGLDPRDRLSMPHGIHLQLNGYSPQNMGYPPSSNHITHSADGFRESASVEYLLADGNRDPLRPRGQITYYGSSSNMSSLPDHANSEHDESRGNPVHSPNNPHLNPQEVLDSPMAPLTTGNTFVASGEVCTASVSIHASDCLDNHSDLGSDPGEGEDEV